jgi:hypothetical protein
MKLKMYNEQYEEILHADIPTDKRDRLFASLMTDLEKAFDIPMNRNEEWESKNRSVIALYRKVSISRS